MVVKHYRNLNGIIGQSKELIHQAYDRGYKQAKIDYARPTTTLKCEFVEGCMQFRCDNCKRAMIAHYSYCPYCGAEVTDYDTEAID